MDDLPPVPPGKERYFQCQRCANCCKWPGDVVLWELEVERIAAFLKMETSVFIEQYTRLRANRTGLSLTEKLNGECIFLDGLSCSIQAVKPAQCRDFPNKWNFSGWRARCEAVPLLRDMKPDEK